MEIELKGGVANVGAVVRVDDSDGRWVLRPSNSHTPSIHRLLRWVGRDDVQVASIPVGVDADGRERLRFIEGEVPVPPYPDWAQSDEALASIVRLIRRYHDAAQGGFGAGIDDTWSTEMADPHPGPVEQQVVCHNDVCLENVVFRDGHAVALLDFDFAAPGRPTYDLACFAWMCVPIDDDSRTRFGWTSADLPRRLRMVADEYGLDAGGRAEMLDALGASIAAGGQFLLRRVEAGDPNFIEMWTSMGGMTRFDRRRAWWAAVSDEFVAAMA